MNRMYIPQIKMNGSPVLNEKKEPIVKEYVNTPFAWLFPDEDLVHVQMGNYKDISCPVSYQNLLYHLFYGAGMHIKEGIADGMKRDLMKGIISAHSDVIRFARWAYPQGWFGFGLAKPKILYLPKGAEYMGNPIADGFAYFKRSFVEQYYIDTPLIRLNRSKGSYTFWQRLPWSPELEQELWPSIFHRSQQIMSTYVMLETSGLDGRLDLVNLCPEMSDHPLVANVIQRSFAEFLARSSYSVNVGARMKIFVPSTVEKAAVDTFSFVDRYPLDQFGSIQAVEPCNNPEEMARIAKLEVLQYSLSSHTMFDKGCGGVVEDLGKWDAVICDENIKMGEYRQGSQVAFTILQHHAAGTAIGINEEWGKQTLDCDFDGDTGEHGDCTEFPVLYDTIDNLPKNGSEKLPKLKLKPTDANRQNFLEEAFSHVVGMASNQTANILSNSSQDWVAQRMSECEGKEITAEQMHATQAHKIHMGTDLKADAFRHLMEDQIKAENKRWAEFLPTVPWPSWPDEFAFRHALPVIADVTTVCSEEKNGKVVYYRRHWKDGVEITHPDMIKHVVGADIDNAVAQIYKLVLPQIQSLDLDYQVPVLPLSHFKAFVCDAEPSYLEWAMKYQAWFDEISARVNYADPDSLQTLKTTIAEEKAKLNFDNLKAAKALWVVAHSKRGAYNTAYSVFSLFLEECKQILMEYQAGKEKRVQITTIISGVKHQVDFKELIGKSESWTGPVEVKEYQAVSEGRLVIRKSICAKVDQRPAGDPYPEDHLGAVIKNGVQPPVGKYIAIIKQISDGAWEVNLA